MKLTKKKINEIKNELGFKPECCECGKELKPGDWLDKHFPHFMWNFCKSCDDKIERGQIKWLPNMDIS